MNQANYSYSAKFLKDDGNFLELTRAAEELHVWHSIARNLSDALVSSIQMPELVMFSELEPDNYSYSINFPEILSPRFLFSSTSSSMRPRARARNARLPRPHCTRNLYEFED
eukprot:7648368-Pyramimonas_sp.AAC.1